MKNNFRRSQISELIEEGVTLSSVEELKEEATSYFFNVFKEGKLCRPTLQGLNFCRLSDEDNILLTAPFTVKEIKEAIFSCEGNKSHGPDGFNKSHGPEVSPFRLCFFLSYLTGSLPFKFLGLPIGANPRLSAMWNPIIDSMKGRLSTWKGRFISLGGRTLIHSVLNSIPLYYLSFFKVPKKGDC